MLHERKVLCLLLSVGGVCQGQACLIASPLWPVVSIPQAGNGGGVDLDQRKHSSVSFVTLLEIGFDLFRLEVKDRNKIRLGDHNGEDSHYPFGGFYTLDEHAFRPTTSEVMGGYSNQTEPPTRKPALSKTREGPASQVEPHGGPRERRRHKH